MKNILTLIIVIASSSSNAQDKTLLGKYTQSFFMYSFSLTLSDSGKFEIDENSDLGTRTTIGTWAITKKTITLTSTKMYLWDRRDPKRPRKELQPSIPEILISVSRRKRLKIVSPKDADMTHVNKPLDKVN